MYTVHTHKSKNHTNNSTSYRTIRQGDLKKNHNINFSHVWPQRVLVIEFKGHNLVGVRYKFVRWPISSP